MGMVVIQPHILVLKLKKTKTKFLRCTGYLNSIKSLLVQIIVLLNNCKQNITSLPLLVGTTVKYDK